MKVLFQTRTNLYDAPGGDLVQINNTKLFLEKQGIIVDISLDFNPDLTGYDVVHLFNLMDPQDIYLQMLNAKRQNKKIVLSTIYGLYTEFERKARGGIFQKIAKYLSNLDELHNGRIPESKSQLVLDFYNYSLNHFIESLEDIPKKYQEIFAD